jgi:purine nucleosidase
MRPVIFDTDIGTDVDDILALVLLANSPELDLIGVTTVYGDTVRRARIVQVTCDLLNRPDMTVVAGEQKTLENRQIYWAGHEGYGIPGLDTVRVSTSVRAVQYILETAERYPNELEILATGPLTNIARVVSNNAAAFSRVKHLYLMGGAYWMNRAEHNIKCDPVAAKIVFESGIPITAIGLDLTLRVLLEERDVRAIACAKSGVGALLEDQIRRYWEFKHVSGNHPHDPLAALAMVRPDLFVFETWGVEVTSEGRIDGFTRLVESKTDNIRIGFDVLSRSAEREIVRRIAGNLNT